MTGSGFSVMDAVQQHRLAGAVEKFNRAKEQFDVLRADMDAFFNRDLRPYSTAGMFDREAWEWVERFQIRENPPLRFGVILGDCVHNLRCALDHAVWQTTLLDGGTPNSGTQFPIASKSESQFENMAKARIRGLSTEHRQLVNDAQPYHRGKDAGAHPLAVLADLSNTDKHQIVNPTYSFMEEDAGKVLDGLIGSYQGPGTSPIHSFWVLKRGSPLEHDEPWFQAVWRRDQPLPTDVRLAGELKLGITFGEMRMDASDFKKIAATVLAVLQAFMRDFPETQFVD
jgi:hypothetical protein